MKKYSTAEILSLLWNMHIDEVKALLYTDGKTSIPVYVGGGHLHCVTEKDEKPAERLDDIANLFPWDWIERETVFSQSLGKHVWIVILPHVFERPDESEYSARRSKSRSNLLQFSSAKNDKTVNK